MTRTPGHIDFELRVFCEKAGGSLAPRGFSIPSTTFPPTISTGKQEVDRHYREMMVNTELGLETCAIYCTDLSSRETAILEIPSSPDFLNYFSTYFLAYFLIFCAVPCLTNSCTPFSRP